MEKESEFLEKEIQQACSVYRQNQNRHSLVFLGHQRPGICCRRSKPLTNKLPRAGTWRGTLLHWKITSSSAACIIERAVVRPPTKLSYNKKSVILSPLNKPNISRLTDTNFIPATHIYKKLNLQNYKSLRLVHNS